MNENGVEIFLQEFITELIQDESRLERFNVHFKRWIARYSNLNRLTVEIPVFGSTEILIKNKYKFLDELYKLSDMKLIKSSIFR